MTAPSWPLVNRGPEALQSLLHGDRDKAHEQVRLLTLLELTDLSTALIELNGLARRYLDNACTECGGAIMWDADEPTGQQPRWRHVDQVASYRVGAHRASPTPVA